MHKHVMAIDASQDLLEMCADLLAFEGIRTTGKTFSIGTLEAIHLVQPDLLIIDYPYGWEHVSYTLLREIKNTPALAAIPVIIWTACYQMIDHHRQWFEDQHIQILTKPFQVTQFLGTIMDHFADDPHNTPRRQNSVQMREHNPSPLSPL